MPRAYFRERIPLTVEAIFRKDGKLIPRRLYCAGQVYEIEKILGAEPFYPQGIGCIAPVRYTVLVRGIRKELYYESASGSWFSVLAREVRHDSDRTHGACYPAQ